MRDTQWCYIQPDGVRNCMPYVTCIITPSTARGMVDWLNGHKNIHFGPYHIVAVPTHVVPYMYLALAWHVIRQRVNKVW